MAVKDKLKGEAAGGIAGSAVALIGAILVYFVISAWEKARGR